MSCLSKLDSDDDEIDQAYPYDWDLYMFDSEYDGETDYGMDALLYYEDACFYEGVEYDGETDETGWMPYSTTRMSVSMRVSTCGVMSIFTFVVFTRMPPFRGFVMRQQMIWRFKTMKTTCPS